MAPSRSPGGFVRTACILASLLIAGWAGTMYFQNSRAYGAWLDENADELGRHQRIVNRYARRLDSGIYVKLPAKERQRDLLASELAGPILKSMENERAQLLAKKKRAVLHLKIALGAVILLMLVARAMPPPST